MIAIPPEEVNVGDVVADADGDALGLDAKGLVYWYAKTPAAITKIITTAEAMYQPVLLPLGPSGVAIFSQPADRQGW
jgi:hypothetical protein